jgi:uncharacterized protein YecT (DUF1311 family)
MRAIAMAVVAIHIGLAHPACAQTSADSDRPTSETLPLFDKNHCDKLSDPADQLFCGDPELNAASAQLASAVQDRFSRLPDRRLAIEENVEWIGNRNLSCGIFGKQSVRNRDLLSVKTCLLKVTEERVAILLDPNFDCLAANTAAATLICSDPDLAVAEMELNSRVLGLIARLKENDAAEALADYARWARARDRKCDLVDKENLPLQELSASAGCVAEYFDQKTAEITAAKGDPGRIFGRGVSSPSPDADAVDLCVAQIHSANSCGNFLSVSRVTEIDREMAAQDAVVIAEVEMVVLSPFAVCSPIASSCTGTCWDLRSGKAQPSPGSRDRFAVSHRLSIEKSFAFQKTEGGWRCNAAALPPIEVGVATNGP